MTLIEIIQGTYMIYSILVNVTSRTFHRTLPVPGLCKNKKVIYIFYFYVTWKQRCHHTYAVYV